MFTNPTEDNIHCCLTDMRFKLVRVIKNWEISGQGEGSQQPSSNDNDAVIGNRDPDKLSSTQLGKLENQTASVIHSQQNFPNHPSHGKVGYWLVYYWEPTGK